MQDLGRNQNTVQVAGFGFADILYENSLGRHREQIVRKIMSMFIYGSAMLQP
jgi:hypothetical protein